jgi:hypothetical protein
MYAVAAGAVVLEYTPNREKDAYGNVKVKLEKAWLVPLNVIVVPFHVAVPVMVFDWPDLSFHCVTVVVEFMVELSPPSSHSTHPGTLRGSNPHMFLDVLSIVFLEQNIV